MLRGRLGGVVDGAMHRRGLPGGVLSRPVRLVAVDAALLAHVRAAVVRLDAVLVAVAVHGARRGAGLLDLAAAAARARGGVGCVAQLRLIGGDGGRAHGREGGDGQRRTPLANGEGTHGDAWGRCRGEGRRVLSWAGGGVSGWAGSGRRAGGGRCAVCALWHAAAARPPPPARPGRACARARRASCAPVNAQAIPARSFWTPENGRRVLFPHAGAFRPGAPSFFLMCHVWHAYPSC